MRARGSYCEVADLYNALIAPRHSKPASLPSLHPLGAASAAGALNPSGPCFMACVVPGARLPSMQDPCRSPATGGRPCARRRGGWAAQQEHAAERRCQPMYMPFSWCTEWAEARGAGGAGLDILRHPMHGNGNPVPGTLSPAAATASCCPCCMFKLGDYAHWAARIDHQTRRGTRVSAGLIIKPGTSAMTFAAAICTALACAAQSKHACGQHLSTSVLLSRPDLS